MSRTLFRKIWDAHLVADGSPALLWVDLHLVHEVTSPQAFEGLELAGRRVRRPDLTVATMDHDVPTIGWITRETWCLELSSRCTIVWPKVIAIDTERGR